MFSLMSLAGLQKTTVLKVAATTFRTVLKLGTWESSGKCSSDSLGNRPGHEEIRQRADPG